MADEYVEVNAEEMRKAGLVNWVTGKTNEWVRHRETYFDEKFKEYYRLYRGIWDQKDSERKSERSKLISPALQQAVEATVAELEEATFGKGNIWFDLVDDVRDEVKQDLDALRVLLADEMEINGYNEAISRIFLNGAIFGTGIGKLMVYEEEVPKIGMDERGQAINVPERVLRVKLEHINPMEFAIDPSARSVDEALGCAHVIPKPKADIMAKQDSGIYAQGELGTWPEDSPMYDSQFQKMSGHMDHDEIVKIVEYHGKVPRSLLPIEEVNGEDVEVATFVTKDAEGAYSLNLDEDVDYVEAVVTIANDSLLLRANENTALMKDRAIIAYQHDTVNETFWGRGVCDKGYNAQKALDTELRARIDAMAFTAAPMMAVDATRIPGRTTNLSVRPGKLWLTTGRPDETLMPIKFADGNSATFHQGGDLERMVQMATGAMDTAAPLTQNPRNQTASGMSMMQSAFIKRSKRTMHNIERQFLDPVIKRTAYRYMQFDPEKFPPFDPVFKVAATMGIAAREYETQQLTQMMQIIPPDHAGFGVILEGLIENTSLSNKQQLKAALEQQSQPDPAQQAQQQLGLETMQEELNKLRAEVKELNTQAMKNLADAQAKAAEPSLKAADIAYKTRGEKKDAGTNKKPTQ